jgi:hypothetical protein
MEGLLGRSQREKAFVTDLKTSFTNILSILEAHIDNCRAIAASFPIEQSRTASLSRLTSLKRQPEAHNPLTIYRKVVKMTLAGR